MIFWALSLPEKGGVEQSYRMGFSPVNLTNAALQNLAFMDGIWRENEPFSHLQLYVCCKKKKTLTKSPVISCRTLPQENTEALRSSSETQGHIVGQRAEESQNRKKKIRQTEKRALPALSSTLFLADFFFFARFGLPFPPLSAPDRLMQL